MRTGYYLRVMRGGRPQSLDIAELSEAELNQAMTGKDRKMVLKWLWEMTRFIKDISPLYQQVDRTDAPPP